MELEFHRWLSETLPPAAQGGVGDDAAVLPWHADASLVVTTDALSDEVDFVLSEIDPHLAGHKALGVNLSDLAAMAAEPVAAVVSLVLPRGNGTLHLAKSLIEGMLPLAEKFSLTIAGGDTNTWQHPLVVSITAFGRASSRGTLSRSGGRPGDALLATGRFGGSLLGRHLQVEPRVAEAILLHDRYLLHAGIDVSDGLALDASRLAEASGCGAVLELAAIPIDDAAHRRAQQTGRTALDHALGDGEDFELLLATPQDAAEQILRDQPLAIDVTRIGELTSQQGLFQRASDGALQPLPTTGYRH